MLNSVTDITNFNKYNFIQYVIGAGIIPENINYCGDVYDYDRQDKDTYYYINDDKYEVSITIPSHIIKSAQTIYEQLLEL